MICKRCGSIIGEVDVITADGEVYRTCACCGTTYDHGGRIANGRRVAYYTDGKLEVTEFGAAHGPRPLNATLAQLVHGRRG